MNTKNKEMQEDIELLLPWHAAGTLSRRDAERVERALANDNELASRYELVREELGEAIRLNETLGAPSARAMQSLFAKIDAEPVRTPRTSFNVGRLVHRFRQRASSRARWPMPRAPPRSRSCCRPAFSRAWWCRTRRAGRSSLPIGVQRRRPARTC